jgi:hypothetical protein
MCLVTWAVVGVRALMMLARMPSFFMIRLLDEEGGEQEEDVAQKVAGTAPCCCSYFLVMWTMALVVSLVAGLHPDL